MDAFFIERVAFKFLMTREELQTVMVPVLDKNIFYEPGCVVLSSMLKDFVARTDDMPSFHDLRLMCSRADNAVALQSLSEIEVIDVDSLNVQNVTEEIELFVRQRKTISSTNSMIEAIGKGVEDSEMYSLADDIVNSAHFKFDTDMGLDPFGDFDRFYDELHYRSACISTGWDSLDQHTRGGIPKGGLYVGIAESNFGKTAWLTSLAANQITMGRKVLYITAESDSPRIAERVMRSTLGITGDQLYKMDRESLRSKVEERVREGFNERLFVKKIRAASTSAVRQSLKEWKTKGVVFDVVIIDYLQLFTPARKLYRSNTNEEMKWVTNELDDLSYEYNCGMVSVAQVRRDEYSKSDFDLSAVAEGITIAHNSTVVWGLMQTTEQKAMGQITFKLLKNRLGARDVKEILNVDLDYMRFSDLNAVIGPDNRVALRKVVSYTAHVPQNNSSCREELAKRVAEKEAISMAVNMVNPVPQAVHSADMFADAVEYITDVEGSDDIVINWGDV